MIEVEKDDSQLEDFPGEPRWWEPAWWRICRFFGNWVYPAYSLRNALFHRHDIVKMPLLKRTEYYDVKDRMLHANMELVRQFIELEKPEEHILWYEDEEGNDAGHRYGECKAHGWECLYPEYDGMYIMDIIKEIHKWWKEDLPRLEKDRDCILDFCCRYCWGRMKSKPVDGDIGASEIVFDREGCPTSLEDLEGEEIDWSVIDRYSDGNRMNVLDEGFMRNKLRWLEDEIERQKNKYLHLCIEVRPYLWT